jgi:hypothetical protein
MSISYQSDVAFVSALPYLCDEPVRITDSFKCPPRLEGHGHASRVLHATRRDNTSSGDERAEEAARRRRGVRNGTPNGTPVQKQNGPVAEITTGPALTNRYGGIRTRDPLNHSGAVHDRSEAVMRDLTLIGREVHLCQQNSLEGRS